MTVIHTETVRVKRGRQKILSSTHMGTVNRGRLLQEVLRRGPSSRADLARHLRVPRGTVGPIIGSLIDEGILEEGVHKRPVDGIGKPSRPVWFTPTAGLCGVVSVRPDRLVVALANARGDIQERTEAPLPVGQTTQQLDRWVLTKVMRLLGPRSRELVGVGLTVPAWCDSATGEILKCTPLPALERSKLAEMIANSVGAPCVLDQDVRAMALGERWYGSCRDSDTFAAAQIDVGVGVGIVLDGRLYRGVHGPAAELGHVCTDLHGRRCRCGLVGCWETIASVRWLRRECASRGIVGASKTSVRRLTRRADEGDDAARQVLAEYADNIGVGLAVAVQLLAIPLFVLHGGIVDGGEALRGLIEERLHARILPLIRRRPQVIFANPGRDAELLGAAAVVLSTYFGLDFLA